MRVVLALLLVFCALIYNVSGGGKGFKAKGVDLKKKLVHKIFHHHHHHHHHYLHHHTHPHHHHHNHHHPHHHHHHHDHHHHLQLPHHHLPHHHHHHDGKTKHHNHHHHHRHYHNPFKHHFHRHHHPHKKNVHRHSHKQPIHQYHRPHKQHIQKHHKDVEHHHSNKRSGITHAPVELPNKLQLHVQIKDSQATKRQSLPDLLANLGQHLVKLGSSLSPKKSQVAVHGNSNHEGDVRNGVPEPKSSTVQSAAVQDSSVEIPTVSPKKNVSVNEVEGLLHHALDGANGDEMESAFSRNGTAEANDALATAEVNRTYGATTAERRNETFSEAETYRPLKDREYDASGKKKESANGTLEEIAAQSFQTETTPRLDQTKNAQSNSEKQDEPIVHDQDQSKIVESKTNVDDVDNNTELEHEKIQENSTQNESSNLTTQSSSEELKRSDMNSTLEDEGRESEKETSKSATIESQKSVTGDSDTQDVIDDEEGEKTEVSGSGEEPSDDDKGTEKQTATDNKESQGAKSAERTPDKPHRDEDENVADQSIDQNKIGSVEGPQAREREGKQFNKETTDSLDEPTKPVSEGNIDQQAVVNVAGNQIMGNQSDDSFHPDSTEGFDSKKGGSNLENNKVINPPDSNDPEEIVSLDNPIRGGLIQDAKLKGDLDTLATQHALSEPEKSIPETNHEKVLPTKNGEPTTQLDTITDNSNQSNEQDHPALTDIDNASGASKVGQESLRENEGTQDQDPHTDIEGFAEGPKTQAVLDEHAEPSSPITPEPQVVNVESSQEGNLQEDTSQETGPEDVADAIPVYTLSSPVGDDSFRGDESILSAPTSSVTTSSANFIDADGNMSTGYSESPSLSEGYGTFTAPVSQSQEDFDSLAQGAGVQRDMLDDPIQESLETTVDSKSS